MQNKFTNEKLDQSKDNHRVRNACIKTSKYEMGKALNPQQMSQQILIKKLFLSKQEPLPQIQSPFLRKTVNKLFLNNSCHLSPIKLQNTNQQHFEKYSGLFLAEELKVGAKALKIFNSIQFANETSNHEKGQARLPKSMSQIKPYHKLNQQSPLPSYSPICKSSKVPTQNSTSSIHFKKSYQKLSHLDSMRRFQSTKQTNFSSPKISKEKEYKESTFAMKHKLAQSLYSQEKYELKMVQNFLTSRQSDNVCKSIKVKTYTKFLPNIMNIQT